MGLKCITCNNYFVSKKTNQLNCSKECSRQYKRKYTCNYDKLHSLHIKGSVRDCLVCNTDFIVKANNVKYCSKECKHEQRLTATKRRYKEDINFKIKHNLRSRLYKSIKLNRKFSAVKDLGCTVDKLKTYLESKFTDGMSWNNYGEWHIDHVVPLANFNLTIENEIKIACNYTNLQPLWWQDNLKKSDKICN